MMRLNRSPGATGCSAVAVAVGKAIADCTIANGPKAVIRSDDVNKHEVRGGARYLGGKIEKAVGDAVDSRDWQVTGVLDQVSGAAENLAGRAQSVAGDIADATPALAARGAEYVENVDRRGKGTPVAG